MKAGKHLWDPQFKPTLPHHIHWPRPSVPHLVEHLQGQWPHHIPGQPIPIHRHSSREEIIPNIQSLPSIPSNSSVCKMRILGTWCTERIQAVKIMQCQWRPWEECCQIDVISCHRAGERSQNVILVDLWQVVLVLYVYDATEGSLSLLSYADWGESSSQPSCYQWVVLIPDPTFTIRIDKMICSPDLNFPMVCFGVQGKCCLGNREERETAHLHHHRSQSPTHATSWSRSLTNRAGSHDHCSKTPLG